MSLKVLLWSALPRAFVGFGALFMVFGLVTWENLAWRSTYRDIRPGMQLPAVEARFKGLRPPPRFCTVSTGGFWNRESASHLVVAGPNRWKYVFYLDTRNRVVDRAKWWD